MTPNYPGPNYPPYLFDSWSDGNASDYTVHGSIGSNAGVSTQGQITDDSNYYVESSGVQLFGAKSIKIIFDGPAAGTTTHGYWGFPFPFSKWPAQDPYGFFNTYNEVSMSELMGQISAVNFYLLSELSPTGTFIVYLEIVDHLGNVADSPLKTYPEGGSGANPLGAWYPFTFPFGPATTGTSDAYKMQTGTIIDWSQITQLRFVIGPTKILNLVVNFDGFSMTKPLIARAQDASSGLEKNEILDDQTVTDYFTAAAIVGGELYNMNKPQIYWELENVGRSDIQAGKTFQFGTNLFLLMRELKTKFNKTQGWSMTGKGYEAT
jgi:hypothetical protein